MIKNLKINKLKVTSLLMAGITLVGLSGCKKEDGKETYVSDAGLTASSSIVSDGSIISVENIRLVDKDGIEVTSLDVVVDGKIMHITNPVDAKLDGKIKQVVYNNEIVSIDSFKLVNIATNKEISSSEYIISGDTLVAYNINTDKVTQFVLKDSLETIKNFSNILTTRGINHTYKEVVRAYILINIGALTNQCNQEVLNALLVKADAYSITDLYGDVTTYDENGKVDHEAEEDKMGYGELSNSITNYNYEQFYEKNVAFENILDLEDLIDDEYQQEIYAESKKSLTNMSYKLNTYTLDSLVVSFVNKIQNNEDIYENMTVGTKFALSPLFAEFRGMIFMVCHEDDRAITKESEGAIGYLAPYTTDEYNCSFNVDMFDDAKELFENDNNKKTLAR